MKKIAWVTLSLLMVAALVLSSCQAAEEEDEGVTTEVVGEVTPTTEVPEVGEEEPEVVRVSIWMASTNGSRSPITPISTSGMPVMTSRSLSPLGCG